MEQRFLFAALDVATGEAIGRLKRQHRSTEFLAFLEEIDASVSDEMPINQIMDNYATHKTDKVRALLAARPRYIILFTPTFCLLAEFGRAFFLNVERVVDQATGTCQCQRSRRFN